MFGTSDLKEAARAEINEFNGLNIYLELLQVIFFPLKNITLVLVRDWIITITKSVFR